MTLVDCPNGGKCGSMRHDPSSAAYRKCALISRIRNPETPSAISAPPPQTRGYEEGDARSIFIEAYSLLADEGEAELYGPDLEMGFSSMKVQAVSHENRRVKALFDHSLRGALEDIDIIRVKEQENFIRQNMPLIERVIHHATGTDDEGSTIHVGDVHGPEMKISRVTLVDADEPLEDVAEDQDSFADQIYVNGQEIARQIKMAEEGMRLIQDKVKEIFSKISYGSPREGFEKDLRHLCHEINRLGHEVNEENARDVAEYYAYSQNAIPRVSWHEDYLSEALENYRQNNDDFSMGYYSDYYYD